MCGKNNPGNYGNPEEAAARLKIERGKLKRGGCVPCTLIRKELIGHMAPLGVTAWFEKNGVTIRVVTYGNGGIVSARMKAETIFSSKDNLIGYLNEERKELERKLESANRSVKSKAREIHELEKIKSKYWGLALDEKERQERREMSLLSRIKKVVYDIYIWS